MPNATLQLIRFKTALLSLALLLTAAGAVDAGSHYDEAAYQEYRAAKRLQVGELCDIWFPTWRPGEVGETYLHLAERCANLDTTNCGPEVRRHVRLAERAHTEIGELFGHGGLSNMRALLVILKVGISVESNPCGTCERSRRIVELLQELADSEDELVRYLEQ